jgi:hypothetical protein
MANLFLKWAGAKGQLIKKIAQALPEDFDSLNNVTIESGFPFKSFFVPLKKNFHCNL